MLLNFDDRMNSHTLKHTNTKRVRSYINLSIGRDVKCGVVLY